MKKGQRSCSTRVPTVISEMNLTVEKQEGGSATKTLLGVKCLQTSVERHPEENVRKQAKFPTTKQAVAC